MHQINFKPVFGGIFDASTNWRRHTSWGILLGLLMGLLSLMLFRYQPIGATLENDTLDFWLDLRGPTDGHQAVMLAVDAPTVRRWGGRTFDAPDIGRLLLLLRAAGARAVALDFFNLADPHLRDPGRDVLERDMRASGIAYLPLNYVPPAPAGWHVRPPDAQLMSAAAGGGHLLMSLDSNGHARSIPLLLHYSNHYYPSLALCLALAVQGQSADALAAKTVADRPEAPILVGGVPVPTRDGQMLLNYPYGPVEDNDSPPFRTLSVAAVLDNPRLLGQLQGQAVVVGPTAPGFATLFSAPTGQRISSTEIQAIALDNLLTGTALRNAPPLVLWLLTLLPCCIVGGFAAARHPLWSGGATLLSLLCVAAMSLSLFEANIWLNVAAPWTGLGLTYLVGVIGRARRETREITRIGSTIVALTQVSDVIAVQTHPEQLLDRVLAWAVEVMQATSASALLLDESGENLRFTSATGPKSNGLLPFVLPVGQGIAGWVAQHGEPAIVNDVANDPRFSQEFDRSIGFSTQSILCVPLRLRDKMLGVIEIINRLDGRAFTQSDAELLAAVANQSVVVLENSRLYDILNQRVERSETELEITNRRLESEKDLMQTVLQSMTDGVVVTDAEGLVRLVNPAASALLPEFEAGAIGESVAQVVPDFAVSAASALQLRQDGAQGVAAQVQLERGDSEAPRLIKAQASPLQSTDSQGGGSVIVFSDVTEERHLEQAKSDFVSFVAHEMRSPLTSISGFSSMLLRSESGAEPIAAATSRMRFLGIIHDESERLTRLINNLLDVARIEAGRAIELHHESFHFSEIAAGVVESQRGYSSRHSIVTAFASDLPPIWADRDKVTQITINLVSNAMKYSPGGVVTIGAAVQSDMLRIAVTDHGPGIAPEQANRLFQRFGRLGSKTGIRNPGPGERAKPTGTGLGLFLTKHLVETHGGQIGFESEPGHGATFYFTLPLATNEPGTK